MPENIGFPDWNRIGLLSPIFSAFAEIVTALSGNQFEIK